jgi:hypothetical protein
MEQKSFIHRRSAAMSLAMQHEAHFVIALPVTAFTRIRCPAFG